MKKNHGVLFGLAVIAIAAIALFAGCSNGSTDDDPGPTAVVLAAGSHGTAGNGEITGLAAEKYAVKTGGQWFSLNGDGKLVAALTVNAAFSATAALSGVTAITKDVNEGPLVNGRTYDVYLYKTDSNAITANEAYTDNKNTIIKETGDVAVTVSAGAANGNTIIFILDSVIVANGDNVTDGVAPANGKKVKTTKTWTFSAVQAYGVKVYFTLGKKFCTLSGGESNTAYVLTRSGGA